MEDYIKIAKISIGAKAQETLIDLQIIARQQNIELYWIIEEFLKEFNQRKKEYE